MVNEVVSYKLRLISKGNSFQPLDLNTENLIKSEIVSTEEGIQIAHPGELVSYFKFKDETDIKVGKNEISLTTNSIEQSESIFNKLKTLYQNSRLNKVELEIDEHFQDSSYPQSVFEKFVMIDGIELDVFRYKIGDLMFTFYNCSPHQMHLKIEQKAILQKATKFVELDFNESFDLTSLFRNRDTFIDSVLKI